jgi:hypothetical protein
MFLLTSLNYDGCELISVQGTTQQTGAVKKQRDIMSAMGE